MEDLLASIRRAIQDDIGETTATGGEEPRGNVFKGTMRELRVKTSEAAGPHGAGDAEIEDIRNRIERNRTIGEFTRAAPAETPPALRPAYGQEDAATYEAQQYADPQAGAGYGHDDPQYGAYLPPPQEGHDGGHYRADPGMMSAEATAAANAAFSRLTDALMGQSMGGRPIEDVAREMLRGMLKQWLDENLPALVEHLVREEIERVARRGR